MKRPVLIMLFVLSALIMATPLWVVGQQSSSPAESPHAGHDHGAHDAAKGKESGDSHHKMMMEKCREMQEKQDRAKVDIKAMDERLDKKFAAMEAAKGDKRIDAMSEVISELVAQRKEMREKMGDIHHGKMCGMMGGKMMDHGGMRGGAMKGHGGMGGMSCCPMMQKGHGMMHGDESEKQEGGEKKQEKQPAGGSGQST